MTLVGLPHSEIPGSKRACRSPRHIAACHVLHRLSVPRHPPSTLSNLTIKCLDLMRSAFPTFFYEHRCAFFYLPVFNCQRIAASRRSTLPATRIRRRHRRVSRKRCSQKRCGIGGADRDRTDDPLLAKQMLSQLSYSPGGIED